MANLDQYANKYQHVRMERRDGILQMTFHSDGGSLQWGAGPHRELPQATSSPDRRALPRLDPRGRLLNGTALIGRASNCR